MVQSGHKQIHFPASLLAPRKSCPKTCPAAATTDTKQARMGPHLNWTLQAAEVAGQVMTMNKQQDEPTTTTIEAAAINPRRARTRTRNSDSRVANYYYSLSITGHHKRHYLFSDVHSARALGAKYVILYTTFLLHLMLAAWSVGAIAPTIDYSHNMRILKLPRSTPVGNLIYRLRGSDGDPESQLAFGVSGIEARQLLDVVPVSRSWNEADVYLRAPLTEPVYNLTIYVTDGNKTTQVESTILATSTSDESPGSEFDPKDLVRDSTHHLFNGSQQQQQQQLVAQQALLPFVSPRHVFHVPENTQPDEPIGQVTALESQKSDLPVRFELRGKGADKFSMKYVFGPRGQSRADIVLAQPVDYEQQNLFALKVLALNAWTNARVDTRNVATMDIVIAVGDVQDTAPHFRRLPPSLHLMNTMAVGELVARLEAEDGDYADQRPINYALDASSPLAAYFSLDRESGELRLARPITELMLHAAFSGGAIGGTGWPAAMLTVYASEQPDPSSYQHLWPPMFAKADLPLILFDLTNEPPQFVGGWQALDTGQSPPVRTLHGFLNEQQLAGTSQDSSSIGVAVNWFTNSTPGSAPGSTPALFDELAKSMGGRPTVVDLGQGPNGTFELSLEGLDAHLFQLDPALPVSRQTSFSVLVAPQANRSLFDRELARTPPDQPQQPDERRRFSFDVVARDFGTAERKSSRLRCSIELLDANDNAPKFDTDLYSWSVYENAPAGQLLGTVRARDPDSGDGGRVRYTALAGRDGSGAPFRLDPESGQVTLEGQLDRERRASYLLLVEARDLLGAGQANFTQLMITVLDTNDNAPTFLQSHYDAVLLPDGTFYQPLVVRALDGDEPGTANSQVAYEIVAGNQNDQFSIDAVSGVIYPNGAPASAASDTNIQIPSSILEPIVPFGGGGGGGAATSGHHHQPELAGKILPNHEVEDAPRNRSGARIQVQVGGSELRPRSLEPADDTATAATPSPPDRDQLPGLDLLLNLESESGSDAAIHPSSAQKRALASAALNSAGQSGSLARLPPITTLVVRAHDFGIPLRSSTVKVNIYNQALLSRSLSLILNGTAEQVELRREAIERAFSSLVGSRASIESVDALSESSSLSVARLRLAIPQHSLVDLTDLSALMSAIDYHPHQPPEQRSPPHYYLSGDRLLPVASGNITAANMSQLHHHLYTSTGDGGISSFALDSANNQLERRLLIYIIIVGVCILALLVIWMIYSCSRESDHVKIIERAPVFSHAKSPGTYHHHKSFNDSRFQQSVEHARTGAHRKSTDVEASDSASQKHRTQAKTTLDSPIGNNLAKPISMVQHLKNHQLLVDEHSTGSQTGVHQQDQHLAPGTMLIRPDHYSMYNGQVWFGPAGGATTSVTPAPSTQQQSGGGRQRRASSAPSAGSLDTALHSAIRAGGVPRQATGQFFPNTLGYMENLAAMSAGGSLYDVTGRPLAVAGQYQLRHQATGRRHRRHRKVAPMGVLQQPHWVLTPAEAPSKPPRNQLRQPTATSVLNEGGHTNAAFEHDLESEAGAGRVAASGRPDSRPSSAESSSSGESLVLHSDQELLGFDSNGTPIIASHQRRPEAVLSRRHSPEPGASVDPQSSHVAGPQDTQSESTEITRIERASKGVREVGGRSDTNSTTGTKATSGEQEAATTLVNSGKQADNGDTTTAKLAGASTSQTGGRASSGVRRASGGPSLGELPELHTARVGSATTRDRPPDLMGELNERLAKRHQVRAEPGTEAMTASAAAATADSAAAATGTERARGRLERLPTTGRESSASAGSAESSATDTLLVDMQNGELLKRQSIFALTYSGLATDKLPVAT